jgi:tetratricopeptide (TPR) repeat protein
MNAPEFWLTTGRIEVDRVKKALDGLASRDYILKLPDSSFVGDEEYVFKHNLEREALVKMTPAGRARGFHHAVADWLSSKDNVRESEEALAMLAQHWEKSNHRAHAARAWFEAGDASRARYANAQAADHYARGFSLIDANPDDIDPDRLLSALHHHGDALQSLGRNDDAIAMFRKMQALAFRLGRTGKGGAAHGRIGRVYRDTGKLELADKHLAASLDLFRACGDDRGVASAIDDLGKLHWLRGDYKSALDRTQQALAMRRKIGDRRSIALSLNNMGLVYQDSGQFKLALDAFEQALVIRKEIGDLVGVAISLNNLGTVAQDQRDDARALQLFKEAHEVAKETGDRNRIALVLTNLGETLNRIGQPDAAIAYLKQAEELTDELGDRMGLAEAVRGLGKAYLAQRDFTKARECTARAVEILRGVGSGVQLGVALRSLGEVAAAGSAGGAGLVQARDHLKQSIAIFEELGNDVELARSCRAYVELLKGTMEYGTDPVVTEEAARFTKRADDVLARVKMGAAGIVG